MPQIPVVSIVDDDASVRAAASRLVRSLGFVAHTFASATEFLNSAQIAETSCIVADVQMPNMSGLELQDILRSQNRDLPIIFITAFPEESIRTRALSAGAVCFLCKPVDGPTLIEHIRRAVGKRGGGIED